MRVSEFAVTMLVLKVCLWSSLILCLLQPSLQSCFKGKPKQCTDADFAPGSTLAGEGFDITKMERKGSYVIDMNKWQEADQSCSLCTNPYEQNRAQKLPLAVMDWRAQQSCSVRVSSQLHRSSESLLSSSSASVENNWKSNLDVDLVDKGANVMMAGTDSKLAEYSMEKTKNDKFSFSSQSISCQYYSYRVSNSPKLHQEFHKAVKQLPKIYNDGNKGRFYKLINNFGTHYITKVKLGGSVQTVTSIRDCKASLQGLSVEEVQLCLDVEASANVHMNEAKAEANHCKKDAHKTERQRTFSDTFNDRFTEIRGGHTTQPDLLFSADKDPSAYTDWLNTLPLNPDIISYSLESLHELLPPNSPSRKNLRSAISHYILEKALLRSCSVPCQNGRKSDPRDPCVCQCHHDAAVNRDCCPTRKGMARVVLTVQKASNLWGDTTTATDAFVKVTVNNVVVQRSAVVWNNNNPHWNMVVDLGSVDLSTVNKVKFEVWDEDSGWDDDLLGECHPTLSAGVKQDVCILQHGTLYYKSDVQCAPSLGGAQCTLYQPEPMHPSLKGWFVSRHAHPIPKSTLLKMGVFVEPPHTHTNQTRI